MKAHVHRRYGGPEVLTLEDVPTPVPKEDELLVRVHATTVTAGDWRALTLDLPRGFGPLGRLMFGVRHPRHPILGLEMSGTVASVGERVTRFRVGDAVFASPEKTMACHAEYAIVPEGGHVAKKPDALSFEEAAALSFGGSTALDFLRAAKLQTGERVLVIGASGGVGTAMVQLAKHMGAHVTGVTSTRNLEFVQGVGADEVRDYTKGEFLTGTFDVIVDTVGETSYRRGGAALAKGGRFLAVATDLAGFVGAPFALRMRGRKVVSRVAQVNAQVARDLADLAERGAMRPVIGHRFPFEQMRDAFALVMSRRKRGSVVVTLVPDVQGMPRQR